jgi:hypothetical protein
MVLTLEDQSNINQLLQRGNQLDAAVACFKAAQASGDVDAYLRASLFFLLAGQEQLSREIAVQLSSTAANGLRKFHVLMAFIFLMSEQPADAREVLEVLQTNNEDRDWVLPILANLPNSPMELMANNSLYRPKLEKSAVILSEHVVNFRMIIRCSACSTEFPASFQKSIFQLAFAPCHSCFRPYVVTPVALSKSLKEHNATYDIHELWKIDELCSIWIHNWNKCLETPSAATHAYEDDILNLAWNTLRFSLSEHYVDFYNRTRRNVDLS